MQRLVTNGLKLASKNGVQIFTDGRNFLLSGGEASGLYSADRALERLGEDTRYINDRYFKVYQELGLNPQYLRNYIAGSEIHVFARGEGLAQGYFQRIGKVIYEYETNAAGNIINMLRTDEDYFNKVVALTLGPNVQPLARR